MEVELMIGVMFSGIFEPLYSLKPVARNVMFSRLDSKVEKKQALPSHFSVKALAFETALNLVFPQNHSQDYRRALEMMRASVFDEVKLSAEDFSRYVLNDWEWRANFLAATNQYLKHVTGNMDKSLFAFSGRAPTLQATYDNVSNVTFEKIKQGQEFDF